MARTSLRERIALARRAFSEGFDYGATIDPDDDLYRRVSSTDRDLSPITQERAREVSHYLWEKNPMAKRLVEMIVDFVCGDGMKPMAKDDRAQEWLDQMWSDPVLGLELRFHDFTRDQALNGESTFRMFRHEQTGKSRMAYIDPRRISRVTKHDEDMLIDQFLFLKNETGEDPIPLELVYFNHDEDSWTGDTFYFPLNRPLTASRGRPDLLALADWVDGYDQMLWNLIDRSGLQNAFIFDVTLTGSTDTEVEKWLMKHGAAPRPGAVRAHNDKESWQTLTPSLAGTGFVENARQIKNYALGGAGVPEAWFAEGDSANRATLVAQSDPTYRMLSRRQQLVKWQWENIFQWHVRSGIESGVLPKNVDPEVVVQMSDPSEKDIQGISQALPQLVNAMMGALEDELISKKTARTIFATVAGMTGVEVDPEEELVLIEEEAAEREAEEEKRRAADQQRQADMADALRAQQPAEDMEEPGSDGIPPAASPTQSPPA